MLVGGSRLVRLMVIVTGWKPCEQAARIWILIAWGLLPGVYCLSAYLLEVNAMYITKGFVSRSELLADPG